MVSRERVLEKRLDDVRTFVNALKIALIVQLLVSFLTALTTGFRLEILGAIILYVAVVLAMLSHQVKIREKLYLEWGKDPMNGKQDIIDAIILAITAIAIYLIVALL